MDEQPMKKASSVRRRWLSGVMCLGLTLVLGACATSNTPARKAPLQQKVSVTVAGADMPVTRSTPLSWYAEVREVKVLTGDRFSRRDAALAELPDNGVLPQWVQTEIQRQMEAKGFHFAPAPTRYQLIGAVVLGEGEASDQLQKVFQLFPALDGSGDVAHPKGTLLLGIWDARLQRGVWRTALQTFANIHAEDEAKHQRLSALIAEMLAKLEPADTPPGS